MAELEQKSGCQFHSSPIITKKGKGSPLGRVGKCGVGVRVGVQRGEEREEASLLGSTAFPFGCVWMYEVER